MKTNLLLVAGLSLWAVAAGAQEAAPVEGACEDVTCLEAERKAAVEEMQIANSRMIRAFGEGRHEAILAWAQAQQGWQQMNANTCKVEGLLTGSESAEIKCRIANTKARTATIEAYMALVN